MEKLGDILQGLIPHHEGSPLGVEHVSGSLDYQREQGKTAAERRRRGLPVTPRATFATFRPDNPTRRAALAVVQEWAQHPSGWLILNGAPGTGKTHLALAVGEALMGTETFSHFRTVSELLGYWKRGFQENLSAEEHMVNLDRVVLILDDLGAEQDTAWAIAALTQLLDRRYRENLPTLITTNLAIDALARQVGDRIADRVYDTRTEKVQQVRLSGSSYRTDKRW